MIHCLGQGQAGKAVSLCVFLCMVLFKLRPAGVQSWWYGCLGKQEIAGPSRLILPTLPSPGTSLPATVGMGWLPQRPGGGHGLQ